MPQYIKSKKLLAERFAEGTAQPDDWCGNLYVTDHMTATKSDMPWSIPLSRTLLLIYRDGALSFIVAARSKELILVEERTAPKGAQSVTALLQSMEGTNPKVDNAYMIGTEEILVDLDRVDVGMAADTTGRYRSTLFYKLRGNEWLDARTETPFTPTAEERLIVASGQPYKYIGTIITTAEPAHPTIETIRHMKSGVRAGLSKNGDWYVREEDGPWYHAPRKPTPQYKPPVPAKCTCSRNLKYGTEDVVCRRCGMARLRLVYIPRKRAFQVTEHARHTLSALIESAVPYQSVIHDSVTIDGVILRPSVAGRAIKEWKDLFPFVVGRIHRDGSIETFDENSWQGVLEELLEKFRIRIEEEE